MCSWDSKLYTFFFFKTHMKVWTVYFGTKKTFVVTILSQKLFFQKCAHFENLCLG